MEHSLNDLFLFDYVGWMHLIMSLLIAFVCTYSMLVVIGVLYWHNSFFFFQYSLSLYLLYMYSVVWAVMI